MPPVNWAGMVYHGLPRDLLPFNPKPRGRYLAFLGRISPEKRPDRAIEIAARIGAPLKIAAKIDRADKAYWEERIKPMVEQNPNVEFIGEIAEREKAQFLGDASALLFPIDWPEPFGMVMIEAMACGTPVIAFRCGSTTEVVDDGISGFLVDSVEEAADAARGVEILNRRAIRACFERRFTAERMARDYVSIYKSLPGVRANTRAPAFEASTRSAGLHSGGPSEPSVRGDHADGAPPVDEVDHELPSGPSDGDVGGRAADAKTFSTTYRETPAEPARKT